MNTIDELTKLKKALDMSEISEAEFEMKKKELLNAGESLGAKEDTVSENKDINATDKNNICEGCGTELRDNQDFCPKCGKQKNAEKQKMCGNCGAVLEDGYEFCPKCGSNAESSNSIDAVNQVSAETDKPKKNLIVYTVVAVVVFAVIIICAFIFMKPSFNFYNEFSDYADEDWCEITEDGSYMEIDTNPYDIEDKADSDAIDAIVITNETLGFSESLNNKMDNTNSLSGIQTEENENFKVSWSYHPNNGLEVMYERKE